MHKWAILALVAGLVEPAIAVAPAGAGSAPQAAAAPAPSAEAQQPALRANANLVLVDVVVTDHDKPVHGLQQSQFHLVVDGHERPIASFDEHHPPENEGTMPLAKRPALPPNMYTNVPVYPNQGALTVLLLDGLNTPLTAQMDLRHQMVNYLGKIKPGTQIAIFTMGQELQMATGFTTDIGEVAKAVKSMKGLLQQKGALQSLEEAEESDANENALQGAAVEGTSSEGMGSTPQPDGMYAAESSVALTSSQAQVIQQFQAETNSFQMDMRVKLTCDQLDDLSRTLSIIPLRKNVIWFSAAFPLQIDPDMSLGLFAFDTARGYSDEIQETTQMLSDARIAIYPVDARGLLAPSQYSAAYNPRWPDNPVKSQGTQAFAGQAATENLQHQKEFSTMDQIAQATGGKAYYNTNGLMNAVADALNEGSNYYTIGYVPQTKELDGQFHKFHVRLDQDGDKLAYRSGYFAEAPGKPSHSQSEDSGVLEAAQHGLPPATQIVFDARVLAATDPVLQSVKIPDAPAGEMAAKLKGPVRRYVVDLLVDPHGLNFEPAPGGASVAYVEFALAAYDSGGNRVNYVFHASQVKVSRERFQAVMASGFGNRLIIDLPQGEDSLRIVIHDLKSNRSGSLEVPLTVAAN